MKNLPNFGQYKFQIQVKVIILVHTHRQVFTWFNFACQPKMNKKNAFWFFY